MRDSPDPTRLQLPGPSKPPCCETQQCREGQADRQQAGARPKARAAERQRQARESGVAGSRAAERDRRGKQRETRPQ
eukprot:12733572-Alexandrium_andersonii.AAC.1